jgi:two-component system phosphate regulon response regulator PhoB
MIAKNKNKKEKVCVIDDEPAFREIYGRKFRDSGYEVVSAKDVGEGFKVILDEMPDIVFLDIILPNGESGMDLLAKLKYNQRTREIPVVLLTNMDSSELREQGCRIGALYFLTKANFLPSELVELTREILAVRDYEKNYSKNVINDKPYINNFNNVTPSQH